MSAVLTPPSVPTTAPAGRFGGLLRAETHRLRARRFIQVLLGLAVLAWIAVTALGLLNYEKATPERLAAAQAQLQEQVEQNEIGRQQCLTDPSLPPDVPVDQLCGPPMTAEDMELSWFLDPTPYSLSEEGPGGAVSIAAATAVLTFLIGATFVGAEWSSRSMVALLFWETRRPRVMGAKIAVVAVATLLVGVATQLAWLATAGIWQAVAGDGVPLPDGFWSEMLATHGRGALLALFAGLLGFGLTNLVRNTGAALGVGFVYFAVVESAISGFRPTWQPWLLTTNAAGLVVPGGLELTIYTDEIDTQGNSVVIEHLVTNLQGGIVMGVVTAVVVGVGVVLFSRRDAQ
ncbi:ABC transporter permease subunit [Modestobacter muralis]|uniref:ABC transporter permease subunit n=1 Tax=Modestobacter muralis TaxID=1608614 RepID=A0A6P0EYX4_9ACTN|nr:ABC transporter permease subunit [Modestobacter muralis]NEK95034.1 ABC transporter permease subunit [Modestobacter muralis]NEN51922.1 ABC transporter permease subunit [Modestobacter muralis]